MRVAIVGGGPGGLFADWHLEAKAGDACQITIFEAADRVGGKIITKEMAGISRYEAGVAEIYDYSRIGPDPLHDLIIKELGLEVRHIAGGPCMLDGNVIHDVEDLAGIYGQEVCDAARAFRTKCADLLSPHDYYFSVAEADNAHPWRNVSGTELLNREISNDVARRYARVMAHSDVAAPPYHTDGVTFLKNAVMDVDGYMDIVSVVGGNEQIVSGLVNTLDADIRTNSNVLSVEPLRDGTYRLEVDANGAIETAIADFVVLAMPMTVLSMINWRSQRLQNMIDRHISYFDRPGHYLRCTLAFKRPFWRDVMHADWWMLDAFDGCCVYDESARNKTGSYGMLAFLIAGNAALGLANASDARIEQLCLDALAPAFGEARDLFIESRVHRWMASVNAIPGGAKARRRAQNHWLDPEHLPGVVMVGDYLFDSTLNGVMDSADAATDILLKQTLERRRSARIAQTPPTPAAPAVPIPSALAVLRAFCPLDTLVDMLQIAWDLPAGARVLHFGSMSGELVGALRARGFDAWGIEFDAALLAGTPRELASYNSLFAGDAAPLAKGSFDVVVDSGLCRLPEAAAERIIAEMARVATKGLFLGSVTIDLSIDVIERYDLLDDIETLGSRWDWSEKLYAKGFDHALLGSPRLDSIWARAAAAGAGPGHWFEDIESVLYSFYQPARARSAGHASDAARGREEAEPKRVHANVAGAL